jgi:hypothetical protein
MPMEEKMQPIPRNNDISKATLIFKKISCHTWLRARDVATLSIQVFEGITPGPSIEK